MPESQSYRFAVDGIVFSGLGQGGKFLAVEWVRRELHEKTGLEFFPGTLNLRIPEQVWSQVYEHRHLLIRIADPSSPTCPGFLRKVMLRAHGRICHGAYLILPEATVYKDVLEIIAPENLRRSLTISDGDSVRVESTPPGPLG